MPIIRFLITFLGMVNAKNDWGWVFDPGLPLPNESYEEHICGKPLGCVGAAMKLGERWMLTDVRCENKIWRFP